MLDRVLEVKKILDSQEVTNKKLELSLSSKVLERCTVHISQVDKPPEVELTLAPAFHMPILLWPSKTFTLYSLPD